MYVETVGTQGLPWREDSRIARLRAYLRRRFFVVTYQRVDYAPMASEKDCGISIEELAPRMFSFNNPFGACPECTGSRCGRPVFFCRVRWPFSGRKTAQSLFFAPGAFAYRIV